MRTEKREAKWNRMELVGRQQKMKQHPCREIRKLNDIREMYGVLYRIARTGLVMLVDNGLLFADVIDCV